MFDEEFFARFLAPGIVHHADVMPGHVGHDGVFVVARLGLFAKIRRDAIQFGVGEFYSVLRLGDVGIEISGYAGKLFAHALDFVALGFWQFVTGSLVVTHGLSMWF